MLRVVRIQTILFLKSMSERGGFDTERLWTEMTLSSIDRSRSRNSSFNFSVVVCRIWLYPTLNFKIKWLWSALPLNGSFKNHGFMMKMEPFIFNFGHVHFRWLNIALARSSDSNNSYLESLTFNHLNWKFMTYLWVYHWLWPWTIEENLQAVFAYLTSWPFSPFESLQIVMLSNDENQKVFFVFRPHI